MVVFLLGSAFASPAYDILKLRDAPSCASLGEATPALRDELLALTAPDVLPAAVPMRATLCLAERFPTDPVVEAAFVAWAGDSARPGEVLEVLNHEAQLREPTAALLVQAALAAPNARVRARAALVAEASLRPSVHALSAKPAL